MSASPRGTRPPGEETSTQSAPSQPAQPAPLKDHQQGAPPPDPSRRRLLSYWWTVPVAGTLGTFGWLGLRAGRILTGKKAPGEPEFTAGPAQVIAPASQLAAEWDSAEFTYQGTPAVALRLPKPAPGSLSLGEGAHVIAFLRPCTHQGCPVVVVRDPEVLALAYNYRAEDATHPQLGCPCHYSVFDPLKGGEAVFGQATLPLPRVQLREEAGQLYAVGAERHS